VDRMAAMHLLLGLGLVAGSAIELTSDNWQTEVVASGKSAFVKFLAPW